MCSLEYYGLETEDELKECRVNEIAANSVICDRWHSTMQLRNLAIKCMMMDDITMVANCLKDTKEGQKYFVNFLDEIIEPISGFLRCKQTDVFFRLCTNHLAERCVDLEHSDRVLKDKCKDLEKKIAYLIKTFRLDVFEVAPRTMLNKSQRFLEFIVFRLKNGELSNGNFFDLIKDSLRIENLRKYLINSLAAKDMFTIAILLARHFQLIAYLQSRWPEGGTQIVANYNASRLYKRLHNSMKQRTYENIVLFEGHPIKWVRTKTEVRRFLDDVKGCPLIGYDSEYRSQLDTVFTEVSIIQISTESCTYLLDVIALEKFLNFDDWRELYYELLCRRSGLTLGYCIQSQVQALIHTISCLRAFEERMENVICIYRLVRALREVEPAKSTTEDLARILATVYVDNARVFSSAMSTSNDRSEVCRWILKEILDTKQQMSNWSVRPLTRKQCKYAAKDSYCLLQLYHRLKELASEHAIDWADCMQKATAVKKLGKFPLRDFLLPSDAVQRLR